MTHIQSQPGGFKPLIERDLFSEMHGVAPGIDPDPEAPRANACRQCATEIFFWGFKDWWVRERQKGFLEEAVTNRKDCPDGEACGRQTDYSKFCVLIPKKDLHWTYVFSPRKRV